MPDDVQTQDAPDVSQLPVTQQAAPPSPVQAQPPAGAPNPVDDHHNFLGRAVKHVASALEGKQVSYAPDPTTGDIKEVVTPRKPGGIFRDILLGSLIGGAASQSNPNRESILGGIATGGAAEHQAQERDDSRAKVRAQESAQVQKQAFDQRQAKQDQNDLMAASVAKSTMSTLDFDHHADLHDPEQIKSHNLSSDVLMDTLKKNGSVTPTISGQDGKDLNATADNGGKLLEMFNNDPQSVMQAPEGFHRVPITQVDTSGLTHKGNQWVDSSGKPVDLADKTTFHLVDIPNSSWNKNVVLPRGAVNDVAGAQIASGDPKGTVSTTLGSVFGLHLKNVDQMNAQRRSLYPEIKNKEDYATQKATLEQKVNDSATPDADKQKLQKTLDYVNKWGEAHGDIVKGERAPTAQADKEVRRKLESALSDGTISDADRKELITRQQEDAVKGVPADIIASIGPKPVPAAFAKGADDPAFKAASKMWGNASVSKKEAMAAASGLARYQMLGDLKDFNVIDADGNMTRMTANQLKQAPPSTVLATQDGTKVMSKQAAIGDIEYNIGNLRKSLPAIDNLDSASKLKLITALRDPDPGSAIKNLVTNEARTFSDPKVQGAINDLQFMAENVMLLRSIQGVGGAGSDMMRHALLALIPGSTSIGIKGYGDKQLDRLEGTLGQLKKGVPNLNQNSQKPQNQNPKPPNQPSAELSNLHVNPQTKQQIGWNGKAWVDAKTGNPLQ